MNTGRKPSRTTRETRAHWKTSDRLASKKIASIPSKHRTAMAFLHAVKLCFEPLLKSHQKLLPLEKRKDSEVDSVIAPSDIRNKVFRAPRMLSTLFKHFT
jgi:hypothetical protein